MTSDELAQKVEDDLRTDMEALISFCKDGILGPGKDQYEEDGMQKFESMSFGELLEYAREEARDLINYGVMLGVRIERMQRIAHNAHMDKWTILGFDR